MNRPEAKKLVREALLKNGFIRTFTTPDRGDNVYSETYAYMGNLDVWRGCRVFLIWGKTYMQVTMPRWRGIPLDSRSLAKLDAFLWHDLGWELYDVAEPTRTRTYMTERGTELVIRVTSGEVFINTPLPPVHVS